MYNMGILDTLIKTVIRLNTSPSTAMLGPVHHCKVTPHPNKPHRLQCRCGGRLACHRFRNRG